MKEVLRIWLMIVCSSISGYAMGYGILRHSWPELASGIVMTVYCIWNAIDDEARREKGDGK